MLHSFCTVFRFIYSIVPKRIVGRYLRPRLVLRLHEKSVWISKFRADSQFEKKENRKITITNFIRIWQLKK